MSIKDMNLNKDKEYTIKTLAMDLGRSEAWVKKHKNTLIKEGIKFTRKQHKQHKQHKHKGLPKHKTTRAIANGPVTKELFFLTNLKGVFPKYLINKLFIAYGLVAPFTIETRYGENNTLSKETIDLLDSNLQVDDWYSLAQELRADPRYLDVHSDFRVYIDLIAKRHKYLVNMEVPPELKTIIERHFDRLFGLVPSEEQIQCVAKVVKWFRDPKGEKSVNIQSDAGTSKTTTCLVIQSILCDVNPLITAKTNKAISKIKHSKTINRLLNDLLELNTVTENYEHILHKASMLENPLDLIIVDEASMVSERERTLLELVCEKVLYVGDKKQLKPIKADQGFNINYIHSLLTQYRFNKAEDDTQILFTKYNKENRYLKCKDILAPKIVGTYTKKLKDIKREDGTGTDRKAFYDNSFEDHQDLVLSYKGDDSIVIAYSNNAADALNNILNEGMGIKIGSKVVLIKNDYETEQYNGFQYKVHKIDYETNLATCISMELEEEYILPLEDLVLGYALTTTKSQGSEWDHVLMIDGTSHISERNRDRYVMVTRSSVSLKILADSDAQLEIGTIEGALVNLEESQEGDRNNNLYKATRDIIDTITDIALDIGLEQPEITKTIKSAVSPSLGSKRIPKKVSKFILDEYPTLKEPRTQKFYTPVFKNNTTLKGSEQTLTYKEANSYPNKIYVAEQLKGSNRILIDCDSKETVELFLEYKDKTESYYSPSSMHLVFITDKIIPSQRYHKLDIQGNKTLSLRHIKDNKIANNLEPIPLTQEVLDTVANYVHTSQ